MSNPPDIQQTLDHCMINIKDAGEAMADETHNAAMMLGAAAMMLASAQNAVHKRAAVRTQPRTQLGAGEDSG